MGWNTSRTWPCLRRVNLKKLLWKTWRTVLKDLAAGISDPANHYLLSALYYQKPDGQRVYIASIYLHQESAWNLLVLDEALTLDVLLHRQEPDRRTRICIPYEVIWHVQRNHTGGIFSEQDTVYYSAQALSKLKYPPQP